MGEENSHTRNKSGGKGGREGFLTSESEIPLTDFAAHLKCRANKPKIPEIPDIYCLVSPEATA